MRESLIPLLAYKALFPYSRLFNYSQSHLIMHTLNFVSLFKVAICVPGYVIKDEKIMY